MRYCPFTQRKCECVRRSIMWRFCEGEAVRTKRFAERLAMRREEALRERRQRTQGQ